MARNNVRGPTSALTEFLRESGITPTTIARRRAPAPAPTPAAAVPSSSLPNDDEVNAQDSENNARATSSRRRTRNASAQGYLSDELDEEQPTSKKRKSTGATEAGKKGQNKSKGKKKAKGDDDDDDYEDSEDAYTALSKSIWSPSSRPPIGNFETCAECETKFTVTKYTMAAVPGPGFLCHKCAKATGADPFKKPAPQRKRKSATDRRTVVNFEERRFPTLVSLCVQIISRHIDDVEALGDIGAINMTEISKAISKNRSLTPENAHIFYDVQNTTLTFFDGTNLKSPDFCTLAHLNPNLTSLRIDFCGRIDDATIATWCSALPSLTRIELLGPFLVRVPAWISFFESHPQLEGFLITQSPRFDSECMRALVNNCSGLKELRLKEIKNMQDEFLTSLKELGGNLTSLDLSAPGASLTEEALIGLMEVIGPTLTHLDLSGHDLVTDNFLHEGIKLHALTLRSLALVRISELTNEGVSEFFSTWTTSSKYGTANPPLVSLDLSRNHQLSTEALNALLAHSGYALQHLKINNWKSTSAEALTQIAKAANNLRTLDVGWCREVNDFVVKELMTECEGLKEVKAWGCNRLTESCPRKRGVSIYGIEAHTS